MTMVKFCNPICRFCQRAWYPKEFVSANHAFCDACYPERREAAEKVFGPTVVSHSADGIPFIGRRPPEPPLAIDWVKLALQRT